MNTGFFESTLNKKKVIVNIIIIIITIIIIIIIHCILGLINKLNMVFMYNNNLTY